MRLEFGVVLAITASDLVLDSYFVNYRSRFSRDLFPPNSNNGIPMSKLALKKSFTKKHRTSIGNSAFSRPKSKRSTKKHYRGQGK